MRLLIPFIFFMITTDDASIFIKDVTMITITTYQFRCVLIALFLTINSLEYLIPSVKSFSLLYCALTVFHCHQKLDKWFLYAGVNKCFVSEIHRWLLFMSFAILVSVKKRGISFVVKCAFLITIMIVKVIRDFDLFEHFEQMLGVKRTFFYLK
jgi:hypothetical protein